MSKDNEKKPGKVELKVTEAYVRDAGRSVARIDYAAMGALNASTGDIAIIQGAKRKTVAKLLPLYPSDEGRVICRIDGLVRANAGAVIGDMVTLTKVRISPAETMLINPLDSPRELPEAYLVDALEGVAAMVGDNLTIPYFGGRLSFLVISATPAPTGTVAWLITRSTKFSVKGWSSAPIKKVMQVRYVITQDDVNAALKDGWSIKEFRVLGKRLIAIMLKEFELVDEGAKKA